MSRSVLDVASSPEEGIVERIAVVADRGKTCGAGRHELRNGVAAGPWGKQLSGVEVDKSRKVPAKVREAVEAGATRIVVWGGDGTVQRAVDALHGTDPEAVSLG